jgi:hypothetical protein
VLGSYSGRFNNAGESVTLKTAAGGSVLADFRYAPDGAWPVAADGGGYSLVRREGGGGDLSDPLAWRASSLPKGSPGRADPPPGTPRAPRIASVVRVPAGLELTIEADPGTRHQLETSADLRTWTGASTHIGSVTVIVPVDAAVLLIRSRLLP